MIVMGAATYNTTASELSTRARALGCIKFGSLLEFLLMHECLVAVCCPGALKRR